MTNVLSLQTLPSTNLLPDACGSNISCQSTASCISRKSRLAA